EHSCVLLAQPARLFAHLRRVIFIDVQPSLLGHRHQTERKTVVALGERIVHVLAQSCRHFRGTFFGNLVHRRRVASLMAMGRTVEPTLSAEPTLCESPSSRGPTG